LTTHYEDPSVIEGNVFEMVTDWIAAGIDPAQATLFIQSRVPQHAELTLFLSLITPVSWLERVPTYKDLQENLADRDLATHGFLGYPVMQAADILIYRANQVPVGEDQSSHVEITREIARRFNHLFGREPGFEEKARAAIKKLGSKKAKKYEEYRTAYQQQGDEAALEAAQELLNETQNLAMGDRERLFGFLEGSGKMILPEPQALLTETPKLAGLDGRKMSKSYNNTIALRDDAETVAKKIRTMPTDPQRVRRTDPGDPEKCPVWPLHRLYSDQDTRDWVVSGCKSAGIGCLECKQPVIDAVNAELKPIQERAGPFEEDPTLIRNILADGCEKAQAIAEETMRDVRDAMGLAYS
jgi:tryptophanyl-tRNA synthetase